MWCVVCTCYTCVAVDRTGSRAAGSRVRSTAGLGWYRIHGRAGYWGWVSGTTAEYPVQVAQIRGEIAAGRYVPANRLLGVYTT